MRPARPAPRSHFVACRTATLFAFFSSAQLRIHRIRPGVFGRYDDLAWKTVRGAISGFADRVQVGDLLIRSFLRTEAVRFGNSSTLSFPAASVMTWQVLVPASMDKTSEQMLRDVLPFSQDWT
jgi:hypothetical protein